MSRQVGDDKMDYAQPSEASETEGNPTLRLVRARSATIGTAQHYSASIRAPSWSLDVYDAQTLSEADSRRRQ